MNVAPLTAAEVDLAFEMSVAEGWNQTPADWRRLLTLDPGGCFGAWSDGRLVGTVTTVRYGGLLAWIGMMIVHPDARRRGIGAALMRASIDYAHGSGVDSIGLDATPAGRPLYESLGFEPVAEVERWQGVAASPGGAAVRFPRANLADVLALDRTAHGVDRSMLLERLLDDGRGDLFAAPSDDGTLQGYALSRPGRLATYLGPVVATDPGAATRLLEATLARHAGAEVCIDLHGAGQGSPSLLAERGLALRRGLTRMRLGRPIEPSESTWIVASGGPELG